MKKLIPADTVDIDGTVWETIGENIRHGAKEFSNTDIVNLKRDLDEKTNELKNDLVYLSSKTASNETKAYDVTNLFTLNGYLNKKGEFINNKSSLCTDYIDAKKEKFIISIFHKMIIILFLLQFIILIKFL